MHVSINSLIYPCVHFVLACLWVCEIECVHLCLQVVCSWFQVVSGRFRSFQLVLTFINYRVAKLSWRKHMVQHLRVYFIRNANRGGGGVETTFKVVINAGKS